MSDVGRGVRWYRGQRVQVVVPDDLKPQGTRGTVVYVDEPCNAVTVRFDGEDEPCTVGGEELAPVPPGAGD